MGVGDDDPDLHPSCRAGFRFAQKGADVTIKTVVDVTRAEGLQFYRQQLSGLEFDLSRDRSISWKKRAKEYVPSRAILPTLPLKNKFYNAGLQPLAVSPHRSCNRFSSGNTLSISSSCRVQVRR
jgi:hypothetical protein